MFKSDKKNENKIENKEYSIEKMFSFTLTYPYIITLRLLALHDHLFIMSFGEMLEDNRYRKSPPNMSSIQKSSLGEVVREDCM